MAITRSLRNVLDDIWAEFRKAYYEDDQEIIEYLAYLLTAKRGLEPIDRKLVIEVPRVRERVNEEAVEGLLTKAEEILENRGGLATFFDRAILFYPTRIRRKNTYPIPRHIVDFMLALLRIEPEDDFADFTCGQGGFIVNRYRLGMHGGATVGIEIAPEIARLAHANAVLHGMQHDDTEIRVENAFAVIDEFTFPEPLALVFDRIAMAPPFDGFVEERLVPQSLRSVDRSNRLLFPRLALDKLTPGGQATLLVAEGLLYNAGASRELRRELLDKHGVKAVITLREGIFLPYVSTDMHILFFQKTPSVTPRTWFLQVANDGYPLNTSRDLIADPPAGLLNDLPLAQAALLPNEGGEENFQPVQESNTSRTGLLYKPIADTPGMVFKIHKDTDLLSLRLFRPPGEAAYLVAHVRFLGEAGSYTVISFAQAQSDPTISCVEDRADMKNIEILKDINVFNSWVKHVYHLPVRTELAALPAGQFLFGDGKAGQVFAITADWRLLGFTKTHEEIHYADSILSVDHYWGRHAEAPPEVRSTAQMLQDILDNQRRINDYAESLQGQIAVKHLLTRLLPPPLLAEGQQSLIASLGHEQRLIWDEIRARMVLKGKMGTTAQHFQEKDLSFYLREPLKVRRTLQLLQLMGLIVQVTLTDTTRYYRLVTEFDTPGEEH